MRILHVIHSLDPKMGGPPMVAAALAAAQAGLGHDVTILCHAATGEAQDRQAQALQAIPHMADVHRITLATPGAGALVGRIFDAVFGLNLRRSLRPAIAGADLVHLHGVWEPLLRFGGVVAVQEGRPYVLCPHAMLDPWPLRQRRLKKKIALLLAYRKLLNRAAFLHMLSRDEVRFIEPLKLRSPTRVIPNGVFLEEIDPLPEPGTFYRSHPQLADRPFILFLGRLHYVKGLDYLADAYRQVAQVNSQVHLVVAGPDDGARDDFQKRIAAAHLRDRVHIVGPLYGRDKFAAMVDATCFCLPSRQEGFSLAITEAMACRVPVVITHQCHFPEVADAGAGHVVALDAQQIAKALLELVQDSTLAGAMGQAGRQLVEAHFTWTKVAQQAIDYYAQVSC